MENVTKRFGKVVANRAVNLELHEGEILSLLGENGSGKTTLMNMLSGIYLPDEGQIYVHGKPVSIASPKDAFKLGIGMIHQHFKLVDVFTAAENIVLGLKESGLWPEKAAAEDPGDLRQVRLRDGPRAEDLRYVRFREADRGDRQGALSGRGHPDSGRADRRADPAGDGKLFPSCATCADGKSIIIITHKLHEVLELSDRVAVLRKGEYIGDVDTQDADEQYLTEMMVGHSVDLNIDRPSR